MRFNVLAALAMFAAMVTPARAELVSQYKLSGGWTIRAIIVCSQYPELNAERLSGFVKEATGTRIDVFFKDGPHQFPVINPKGDPIQKMILVAAGKDPGKSVVDCVRKTVSFGDKVFEQLSETWKGIGKPLPDEIPINSNIRSELSPVFSASRYSSVDDLNGKPEWLVLTKADRSAGASHWVNRTMIDLFSLDPKTCERNSFCAVED